MWLKEADASPLLKVAENKNYGQDFFYCIIILDPRVGTRQEEKEFLGIL